MGTLSHIIESVGIATVGLSLVRGQTERVKPPRALWVHFPFGRPLGRPDDPEFQHRVLAAALALLDRPEGPVLEDFPEVVPDDTDAPLACAVPPRFDPSLHPAVDEVHGLRKAYDRQLATSGKTMLGRVVGVDDVADMVARFVRIVEEGQQWKEAGLPALPHLVALDIRAYFQEAALGLAEGVTPGARASESWFFQKTRTGKLLIDAQTVIREQGASREDSFFMVPRNQLPS